MHCPRNADPTGRGERFQARGDIDAVAEDVPALRDDVSEIDADAKPDASVVWYIRLTIEHAALDLGGAPHRVDDARKFRQQTVTGILDDAATVLRDLRINQLPEMRLEALVRALLVGLHQTRIARHIGGEDRGKATCRGHYCSGMPALRRPAK